MQQEPKVLQHRSQNPILRTGVEQSNAAAMAADSVNAPDANDELNLSHDGNGGRNALFAPLPLLEHKWVTNWSVWQKWRMTSLVSFGECVREFVLERVCVRERQKKGVCVEVRD